GDDRYLLSLFSRTTRAFLRYIQKIPVYAAERLVQHEGTIPLEFKKVLSPESWYFNLQIVLILTAIALAMMVRRNPLFAMAAVPGFALESAIVTRRLSFSSMFDVVALSGLILLCALAALKSAALSVAMVAAIVSAPLFCDFPGVFRNLAYN